MRGHVTARVKPARTVNQDRTRKTPTVTFALNKNLTERVPRAIIRTGEKGSPRPLLFKK
uniref:Uncharacterized protein n=1 Tax=Anguilla anguilla TaxID=7936 RepID=A0A0E9UAF9_ANGAN